MVHVVQKTIQPFHPKRNASPGHSAPLGNAPSDTNTGSPSNRCFIPWTPLARFPETWKAGSEVRRLQRRQQQRGASRGRGLQGVFRLKSTDSVASSVYAHEHASNCKTIRALPKSHQKQIEHLAGQRLSGHNFYWLEHPPKLAEPKNPWFASSGWHGTKQTSISPVSGVPSSEAPASTGASAVSSARRAARSGSGRALGLRFTKQSGARAKGASVRRLRSARIDMP